MLHKHGVFFLLYSVCMMGLFSLGAVGMWPTTAAGGSRSGAELQRSAEPSKQQREGMRLSGAAGQLEAVVLGDAVLARVAALRIGCGCNGWVRGGGVTV